ncbi:MAG: WD40 repeat domain-containing protein, partial [Verrucomicrobiota bacterium]
ENPGEIIQACASQYRLDRWDTQDIYPGVWIEKDALSGVFERVCGPFDVPLFACRGYTSQSEMWAAGQRFVDRIEAGKKVIIFHFGDHDPSGIDMTRDILERLDLFVKTSLGRRPNEDSGIEVKRIALNMDQIEELKPPENPAKITDSRAAKYIQRFGESSWELDAIEPARLAKLVSDAIIELMDFDLFKQNEAKQRHIADEARQTEAQLRVRAQAQELAARQRAYASDISRAQQALAFNNLGRARELLNRQRPQSGQQDLRGWEWRFLWKQCQSDALFTLCQETNQVGSLATAAEIAVSADGRWLAVGDGEKLSVWDLQTRRIITSLPAGKSHPHLAFSPRAELLAYSALSRQSSTNGHYGIRRWNSETRMPAAELPLPGPCLGLAFSGDGQTLVTSTAGEQGQIALWRMADGQQLASYPAPQAHFTWTAFAVAQNLSVAAHATRGDGRKVRIIDLASGQERWSARAAEESVMALALSSDGKILASGAGFTESTIRLWDVATGNELRRLEGHRSFIAALRFWPDGRTLASASGDQTIRLWDLSNLTTVPPPRVLRGHQDEVHQLALLPDNSTLVSGCKDGSVCFWDTSSRRQQTTRITVPGTFRSWGFDPESQSVVTVAGNGNVARWKGAGFQETEPLFELGTDLEASLISPDTRWLATQSKQRNLRVWDLHRGALLREWTNGISPQPFAFLTNGKQLVTMDRGDGVHREWNLTTWKETQSWRGAAGLTPWCTPTFSPDEHWCLTLNGDGDGL